MPHNVTSDLWEWWVKDSFPERHNALFCWLGDHPLLANKHPELHGSGVFSKMSIASSPGNSKFIYGGFFPINPCPPYIPTKLIINNTKLLHKRSFTGCLSLERDKLQQTLTWEVWVSLIYLLRSLEDLRFNHAADIFHSVGLSKQGRVGIFDSWVFLANTNNEHKYCWKWMIVTVRFRLNLDI